MIQTEVSILLETLQNKKKALHKILQYTEKQEMILQSKEKSEHLDEFDRLMESKEKDINRVLTYDKGFDSLYKRIGMELKLNKGKYRLQIQQMQAAIKEMTELSIKIKNAEKNNKALLERYCQSERSKIKTVKSRSNITKAYGQAMTGQGAPESFFMDRKN